MRRMTSGDLIAGLQAGSMRHPAEAIIVTQDGNDLFVLLPVDAYVRLQSNDTPNTDASEISDADLDSIEWNR